jgi:hypothetical protein
MEPVIRLEKKPKVSATSLTFATKQLKRKGINLTCNFLLLELKIMTSVFNTLFSSTKDKTNLAKFL